MQHFLEFGEEEYDELYTISKSYSPPPPFMNKNVLGTSTINSQSRQQAEW